MGGIVLVKLGGSLITDKARERTVRRADLLRLVAELAAAAVARCSWATAAAPSVMSPRRAIVSRRGHAAGANCPGSREHSRRRRRCIGSSSRRLATPG